MNPAEITLTLAANGELAIQSNTDNKIVLLGMLGMAQAHIAKHEEKQQQQAGILVARRNGFPPAN